MKLIGLAGTMGAGKTTAANYIRDKYDYQILSFAAPIKKAAEVIFDLPASAFNEEGKKEVDPYWGITRRTMLQKLGTECVRDIFQQDFWVKRAHLEVLKRPHDNVAFDDLRFTEEALYLRENNGVIIIIHRGDPESPTLLHKSEQVLENVKAYHDHWISNTQGLDYLYAQIDKVFAK